MSSLTSNVEEPLSRSDSAPASAPIYKFVLTGGPCAGKTTAMAELQTHFSDKGYRVFLVPEAATLFFSNGVTFEDIQDPDVSFAFQQSIITTQMRLEDAMEGVAKALNCPSVILCDRGLMDGAAYTDKESWDKLLAKVNLNSTSCREGRYNAVFHMVTAANGAAEYYSLDNNAARTESIQQAIDTDNKLQRAWLGHPHLYLLRNIPGAGFEGKLAHLFQVVNKAVGMKVQQMDQHRMTLREPPDLEKIPEPFLEFEVERTALLVGETGHPFTNLEAESICSAHVRRRTQGGSSVYGLTHCTRHSDGCVTETKRIISEREYDTLLQFKDTTRAPVLQKRINFIYNDQSFELHSDISGPYMGKWVLYAKVPHTNDVEKPTFLSIGEDIGTVENI